MWDLPVSAIGAATALLLCVLLAWFALRRGARGADASSLSRITRGPRVLGYSAVFVLLGAFAGWSWIAPLASAAIAPGVVSPDGLRKTIQHLEGGIIRAIHVREGEVVTAGQKLVTLEETQARAKMEGLRERYFHLLASEARLIAEQTAAAEIAFADELKNSPLIGAQRAMASQEDLLRSRRATLTGKGQVLDKKKRQLEEEIGGLRKVIAAQATQLQLIERELGVVHSLYDKGLERLPRVLALQRVQAEIIGGQANNAAHIARSEQQIGEAEMQLLTMREQDRERANDELTKVRASLAELLADMPAREDVLTRAVIRAPIGGIVMNVKVTTELGVVGAGHPILDIVPSEAKLIIDARVKPIDIKMVRSGMPARVLLTAYRQRNLPQVHGTLRSISADKLTDDRTGEAYFLAKVEVDPAELAQLKDVRLSPGMPAEVMLLTGEEQTPLDYLLRPLLESITKSFRES